MERAAADPQAPCEIVHKPLVSGQGRARLFPTGTIRVDVTPCEATQDARVESLRAACGVKAFLVQEGGDGLSRVSRSAKFFDPGDETIEVGDLPIVLHGATHFVTSLLTTNPGDRRFKTVAGLVDGDFDAIDQKSDDLLSVDLSGRCRLP
jgi:hypothetical protein